MKKNSFDQGVYVGAVTAFVLFLVLGAVPGLLYGGYLGVMMGTALFGHGGEITLAARIVTGGGMLLGFFASFGLFMVVGSLLGGALGAAFGGVTVPDAAKPVAGENPASAP